MPRLVRNVPCYTRHTRGQARTRYNGKCLSVGVYGSRRMVTRCRRAEIRALSRYARPRP